MNPERIIKQTINTAKSIGEFLLWYVRDLETPAPTQAAITYYPDVPPIDETEKRLIA